MLRSRANLAQGQCYKLQSFMEHVTPHITTLELLGDDSSLDITLSPIEYEVVCSDTVK